MGAGRLWTFRRPQNRQSVAPGGLLTMWYHGPMKALPDRRGPRLIALGTLTFFSILFLIHAVEFGLWLRDPRRRLPVDGEKDGVYYTWGHPWRADHRVVWNGWHFRQKRFEVPKPRGVRRVMVVGDSLTFGVGLAPAQRYTELMEDRLNELSPRQGWEVINLGLMGAPTVFERDVVVGFGPLVAPDRIVVGFSLNDVDPAKKYPTEEHRRFEERHGRWMGSVEKILAGVALPRLAGQFRKALNRWAELSGRVPDYEEQLRRAYAEDAPTWIAFREALRDIKKFSDGRRLPAPLFAALLSPGSSAEVARPTPEQRFVADRVDQAARAAEDLGFAVVRFEKAVGRLPPESPLHVNPADGHPGPELNRLFADGLARAVGDRHPPRASD